MGAAAVFPPERNITAVSGAVQARGLITLLIETDGSAST
jgi:hypothetical protein